MTDFGFKETAEWTEEEMDITKEDFLIAMGNVHMFVDEVEENVEMQEMYYSERGKEKLGHHARLQAAYELHCLSLKFASSSELSVMGSSGAEFPWEDEELIMRAMAKTASGRKAWAELKEQS